MKICSYLLWFFIIIFAWQLILIIIAVNDLLVGINLTEVDIEVNTSNSSIPRIIHQIWKTSNLSTYPINNSHIAWKKSYPSYRIKLWSDKDIEELLSKEEYLYLYPIYKSYLYGIQRADLARLIILYDYGGIYADLDVFPSVKNIEDLLSRQASFIIPRSSSDNCLINHFLMAEKHSHIIDYILHEIDKRSFLNQIYVLPYLEVFSTGSIFLTKTIRKRIKLFVQKNNRLLILSSWQISRYIIHDAGRSWHLFDGYLLNKIQDGPRPLFTYTIIVIFLIFCIVKLKRFQRKQMLFR